MVGTYNTHLPTKFKPSSPKWPRWPDWPQTPPSLAHPFSIPGPIWWERGPSAAPFVDCGAPFVHGAVHQRHQSAAGLAAWGALLSAGSEKVQHLRGRVLPGAMEEEIPVSRCRQDL